MALYDGELTFDMLLNAAKAWGTRRGGLREYCICHELHAQPADPQRDVHTGLSATNAMSLPGARGRIRP